MAGRKYPIYDRAPERPFKCIVSGLAGPVVDLGTFVEGYGRVYLSVNVVAAIAATHGFLNDREAAELKTQLAEARHEADRWPAVLEELVQDVRDAVDRAGVRAAGGVDSLGRPGDSAGPASDRAGARDADDGSADGAGGGPAGGTVAGGVPAVADVPFDQPDVPSE